MTTRDGAVEVATYRPDFQVEGADGRWFLVEVKGHETQLWKLKRKMFEACYPDLELRVVKA